MYKVLLDGDLMCDSRIEELALIDPVVILEENKAGSFSFIIPPVHPKYDDIASRKSEIEVYEDGELVFCGPCIEADIDFYKQKKIRCEGELTYFNDSIQRPARYQEISIRRLMEEYVANHNAQVEEKKQFQVGVVTVEDSNNSLYCYTNMDSTMKCIKEDLLDDYGGILRVRHEDGVRYIDYLAESPNKNKQTIKFGKNLIDLKTNIDSTDIATAVIPLGEKLGQTTVQGLEMRLTVESLNDGKDYIYSESAVKEYGWIYKTLEYDDVTTPEALLQKGQEYLSEIQFENMFIEARAVDLHLLNPKIERFCLSDQIKVISEPHGLNKYFPLTKMTLNLNSPETNMITLGKKEKLTLSGRISKAEFQMSKKFDTNPVYEIPGYTGTFKTSDGMTATVSNGRITDIS